MAPVAPPEPPAVDPAADAVVEPVSLRETETPEPLPPPKAPEPRRWAGRVVRALWTLVTLAGLVAVVAAWLPVDVPPAVPGAGAVVVSAALGLALAARTGGRPLVAGALALLLAGAAVLSSQPMLLATAAVGTAAVGAVLAVMVTSPAARVPLVARECLVAVLVAAVAALAANAYDAQLHLERAGYLVLGVALVGALSLSYRLAAGLHGLGRRGLVMLLSGLALLAVSLAYTEALARWGSPELVDTVEGQTAALRDLVGAVPRPTEFVLGIPALAWGVSTRARRRQGWWGTGFGAAATAAVATSLLDPAVALLEAGLATAYSLVVGLLLGYLVIRADTFLSGARGRCARRAEEATAHRPEPGRSHPLL